MCNVVKRTGKLEVHPLARCGMFETNGLCLKIETVCLCAIEFVADNRAAETVIVSTVHTQLVSTARMRPKGD